MKSLSARIGSFLLIAVALTAPLYAQFKLEKTEPAANSTNDSAPKQIQIWFNEAPINNTVKINLTGPHGLVKLASLVINGSSISAAVVGTLPDGAYLVSWQSAGEAGHVQRGQFKFIVKTAYSVVHR